VNGLWDGIVPRHAKSSSPGKEDRPPSRVGRLAGVTLAPSPTPTGDADARLGACPSVIQERVPASSSRASDVVTVAEM
jgi:hypothetical protein